MQFALNSFHFMPIQVFINIFLLVYVLITFLLTCFAFLISLLLPITKEYIIDFNRTNSLFFSLTLSF